MNDIASAVPFIRSTIYYLDQPITEKRIPGTFLCLLSGSLLLDTGKNKYAMGKEDLLYLPPETSCIIIPNSSCILLYLELHPYFLLKSLGTGYTSVSYWSREHSEEDNKHLTNRLAAITATQISDHENNNLPLISKAYDFLSYFSVNQLHRISSAVSNKTAQKLSVYQRYMETNFCSPISLTDAAEHLGYTPQYLSNFLKKHLNCTFQEHLTSLRIMSAVLLVRLSSESDNRIAALSGFPNTAAFIKAFIAAYNLSPQEYRKQYGCDIPQQIDNALVPITNQSLILDFLYNYLHYTNFPVTFQEHNQSYSEKVNLSKSVLLNHKWNQIINIGPVLAFDKPAFRATLRIMQQQLHFSYGRCVGLFSVVFSQNQNGKTVFDFSRLFEVIDFLRSIDLYPFFELGNKPFEIYNADVYTSVNYEDFLDAVSYDQFFFQVFPAFIEAAINRYGLAYFTHWKFELWRNCNPAMTSLEPTAHYLERFQKTAGILKSFSPSSALGGPGYNTYMQPGHFAEILEAFQNAAYRPDFLSAYCFPYASENPESTGITDFVLVTEMDYMKNKISILRQTIQQYQMGNIPLYITEYGAYLSHSNYINDSNYPALFILQQFAENYQHTDGLAYWLASDIPLEYQHHSYPFFGGNGLFSRHMIPKASYFAFDFLKRLGKYYVSSGKYYMVTASEHHSFQVLCFHPAKINKSFAEQSRNRELLYSPYSAFDQVLPLELSFRISGILPGTYLIREITIGQNSGNVLKIWGQLNYWKELGPEETDYLRAKSTPSVKLKTELLDENYLLQTHLDTNEAKLFTFDLYV